MDATQDNYTASGEARIPQEAALEYAGRGWPVFPLWPVREGRCACGAPDCGSPGKHPHGRLAPRGVHEATTDPGRIRAWWGQCQDANIGLATGGRANAVVLDVDPGNGGDESLRRLELEHGALPGTRTARTGNGGRHIWFQHPGGQVKNSVGALGPGLDIRGDGGYVVVPPSSLGPGRDYEWLTPDDAEPLAAPGWLADMVAAGGNDRGPVDVASALAGVPEGQRDIAVFRLACRLRRDLDRATATELVLRAARACDPPFDEGVALEKVERVYREYPREYHHTDKGTAELMADVIGQDVRWCGEERAWYIWNGRWWERDWTERIYGLAKGVVQLMNTRARAVTDEDNRRAAVKYALECESQYRLTQVVQSLKSEPGIGIRVREFNRPEWLLPLANGTLDLRTRELGPHQRDHYFTRCVDHLHYDPAAGYEEWAAAVAQYSGGDGAVADYLQRVAGYFLTGSNSEKAFFISHGPSNSGKSVYAWTLARLLGPFSMAIEAASLALRTKSGADHSEDIAQMEGKRFVYAAEGSRGFRLNEGFIKKVTGDDTIRARGLHENSREFKVQAKVWYATNDKPIIADNDSAIWNRVKLIPFLNVFPTHDAEGRRLPGRAAVQARLEAQLPGILNWALDGLQRYLAEGLTEPAVVNRAVAEYRDEMNTIGQFLEENYVRSVTHFVPAARLVEKYNSWCKANNVFPLGRANLNAALEKQGLRPDTNKQGKIWKGIRPVPFSDEMAYELQVAPVDSGQMGFVDPFGGRPAYTGN